MAKSKSKKIEVASSELPDVLREALERAKANKLPPEPSLEDAKVIDLYGVLAPREVKVGRAGDGSDRMGQTGPMLTLFWSSSAGAWQVTVSDRLLKFRASVLSVTLSGALQELSEGLRSRTATVQEIVKRVVN